MLIIGIHQLNVSVSLLTIIVLLKNGITAGVKFLALGKATTIEFCHHMAANAFLRLADRGNTSVYYEVT